MKYITKHLLSILITIITMFPVTASSVTVTVDSAFRSMNVGNLGTSKIYTGTGIYNQSPAYAYPSLSTRIYGGAQIVSSDIPASGDYSSYVVSAEMYTWIADDLVYPVYPPEANLSLLFTLGSTSNYWINGLVDATDGADLLFSLTGPSGEICSLEACLGGGILPAGQYELHAKTFVTTTSGPDTENVLFNFDVTVSSVPIPASVWLFGSGLIGLIGIARCKKA